MNISWPTTPNPFLLEHSSTLDASAAWQAFGNVPQSVGNRWVLVVAPENQPQFFRLREEVPGVVGVVETSPRPGETGVSVTRETVFRLSGPLAPESLLAGAGLFAEYGGRQLLARTELSGDRRSATLFLLENMPASSQVRVTLDSNGLRDAAGRLIDADGDGTPGGIRVLEFSTAGITGLPGTSVFGKVYASEKNPDGSNKPLENVTITVDGAEESLRVTTDAAGGFVLSPAPAGRFFVHVDGRTATGSAWPGGAYYPFVGKAWEALSGSTNNPAGGSGEIFLPLIVEGSLKDVSATENTKVTFSPTILAANPGLNGVEINVPANSLFSDNGVRGGKMGIVPVPPNRLPEPLPDGLTFPVVITVQTDGGSNFDRPVPVRFPNLPDPATGVTLPPGAKTALWSFNHDTGRWEVQGSMTISADGLFAVSDSGVGIRQPGWHGTNPGGTGTGPEGCHGDDCDGPKCGAYPPNCCADWPTFKAPCQLKQDLALEAIKDLAVDDFLFLLGGTGSGSVDCSLGLNIGTQRVARDCVKVNRYSPECGTIAMDGAIGGVAGCIPVIGGLASLSWGSKAVFGGALDYSDCLKTLLAACGATQNRSGAKPAGPVPIGDHEPRLQRALDALELQLQLSQAISNGYTRILGNSRWAHVDSPEAYEAYHGFMLSLADAANPSGPNGRVISSAERAALLALPRPNEASDAEVHALIDRLQSFESGALGDNVVLRAEVASGFDLVVQAMEAAQAAGWIGPMDGFRHAVADLASLSQPRADQFPRKALDYRLHDLDTGFVRRGRLSDSGQFEGMILRPNTFYSVVYFDSDSSKVGGTFFFSKGAGEQTEIPMARMFENSPQSPLGLKPDQDGDGLSDQVEKVLGTSLSKPDSDGDGVPDGLEVRMGGNPLDGVGLPIGVVATSPTPGEASQITAGNGLAVVGCGQGLAVFDISNPKAPVRVAVLPGAVGSVALRGTTALMGSLNGLRMLDLSRPSAPNVVWTRPELTLVRAIAFDENQVLALSSSQLTRIDLASGTVTGTLPVSNGEDLLIRAEAVYVLGPNKLTVVRNGDVLESIATLAAAGSSGVQGSLRRLAVAGTYLYAQHNFGFNVFDISDPLLPSLVKDVKTPQAGWRQFMPVSRELAIAVVAPSSVGPHDVSLYRFTNNGSDVQFLSTFTTPGQSASLAIASGRAFVADGSSGLTVINFLQADLAGIAPTVSVTVDSLVTPPKAEEGRRTQIVASAQDDSAVAYVDFLINGTVVGRDDAYPFEWAFQVPPASPTTPTLRVRARAVDVSGNSRESEELILPIVADATPPRIAVMDPAPNDTIPPGAIRQVNVTMSESLAIPLPAPSLTLSSPGPDGQLGTPDDLVVSGAVTWIEAVRVLRFEAVNPLAAGRYRVTMAAGLTDLAGNTRRFPATWDFSTGPAPRIIEVFPPRNFVRVGGLLGELRYTFDQPVHGSLASTYVWWLERKVGDTFVPVGPIEVNRSADGRVFSIRTNPGLEPGEYRVSGEGPNVQSMLSAFTFRNVPNEAVSTSVGAGTGLQTNWKYFPGPGVDDELIVNLPGQLAPIETSKVKALTAFSDILFRNQTIQLPTPILANAGLEIGGTSSFGDGVTHVRGSFRVINAGFRLGAHVLNLYGGSQMENASIRFEDPNGALINHPGSLLSMSNLTVALTGTIWNNAGRFINLGTVQALGGAELTPDLRLEDVRARNDGRIEVKRGGLKFNSLENEGTIDVSPGARLHLALRSRSGVSSRLTGLGTVEFGEINPTTHAVLSAADAEIRGEIDANLGLRLLAGKLTVHKPFERPSGSLELAGSSFFQAMGPVSLNSLTLLDGDVAFNSDSVITTLTVGARSSIRSATLTRLTDTVHIEQGFDILGSGLVEFAGSTVVSNGTQNAGIYLGNATLRNSGTWHHGVNSSQASVFSVVNENGKPGAGSFENTGVFEQVTVRPLAFHIPLRNRGKMFLKGAVVSFDARKAFSPQRSGAYLPGPGAEVVLDGTVFQHDFAGTLDLVAGVIRGTGIVTALDPASAPKIINRSTLQPGAPLGVLTVRATGGFEQTATGELAVTLANEGYSQLFCNGIPAKLGGTLRVALAAGFDPILDSTFPVVAAGSIEGTFASVVLPDIGVGKKLAVEYSASTVQLRVVAN